jgi:DUF4097 and DUF4098 domain-containing protein YvlB
MLTSARGVLRLYLVPVLVILGVALVALACDDNGDDGDNGGPTETRDDSFRVGASPVLVVSSENGRIEVETGSAGTVRVEATLRNAPKVRYEASQDGDTVRVEADVERGARKAGADIIVVAPPETEVNLETSNGMIEVEGLKASGTLRTSNGLVAMTDIEGAFDVRTSNGGIEVSDMAGTATLDTSNGLVSLKDVTGTFDVSTSNGPILFSGEMTPGGENRLETSNGGVTVELEGTPSVDLDASAGNGRVTSKLSIEATRTETGHLVGTIGDGEAELFIRTSNGSVTIE